MPDTLSAILVPHAQALLGYAVVFALLEFGFPAKRVQRLWRRDSALDLAYSFSLPLLLYVPHTLTLIFFTGYFLGAVPADPDAPGFIERQLKVVENPRHGAVSIHPGPNWTYLPQPGFSGLDTMVTRESAGENETVKTILIRVEAEPQKVSWAVTSVQRTGRSSEGLSGFFMDLRTWNAERPFLVQLVLVLFAMDFIGYWRHRLMHSKYFWPFHTIHHSSGSVDWLSNERMHPVNQFINTIVSFLILIALVEDPFLSSICIFLRRGYSLYIHCNARISYGPLDYVLTSPLFHRWHHANCPEAENRNFAIFFSCIDWMFGTHYLPARREDPEQLGLVRDRIPDGLLGQWIYPFAKLFRVKDSAGLGG
ncbi:MAG: hypothetical protein COV67_06070 [Nitrospinae bacterium CG11_big_fil_rev_8_21_14_0_20_56_8]|nr:MAG: hypothetical protein COV67_06070 [Nitrospinae bacterium CG11_big_fil_rev_8_21_14_0_20_56_8]